MLSRRVTGFGAVLAACCVGVLATSQVVVADSSVPTPAPVQVTPALPAPTGAPPTSGGLAAALNALDDPALGPSVGAVVMDAATGSVLYERSSSQPRIPASTLKILTGTAVTTALGADSRITTRVVAGPDGSVILVGGGDPDLLKTPTPDSPDAVTLADLAKRTAAALGVTAAGETGGPASASADGSSATDSPSATDPSSATGSGATGSPVSPSGSGPTSGARAAVRVHIDDSLFTGPTTEPSWPDTYLSSCMAKPIMALSLRTPADPCSPESDPALSAGRAFAEQLAAQGVTVTGDVDRLRAPAGAQELAAGQSAQIAELVEQTSLRSDNVAAEMLAHLAGAKVVGDASFAGGAAATSRVLAGLGVPVEGLRLVDASGLSRDDRVPAATTAAVLSKVATNANPQIWPVGTGLPVAGFDGTLAERFGTVATESGRGVVRAKTGTLTSVGALGGLVVDRDGRLLIFDFVADQVTGTDEARTALDRAAAALADCGCGGAG